MSQLLYTCPKTQRRIPTGVATDFESLRVSWTKTLKLNCPLCGGVHEICIRETYTDGALFDATDQFSPLAGLKAASR